MKLWDGRFTKGTSSLYDNFANSITYDYQLFEYDIQGSIAHSKMLASVGVISEHEGKEIEKALLGIQEKFDNGQLDMDVGHEDVHMWIEAMLIKEIGEIGKKLHTGRSRNDQVALDLKLYMKDSVSKLMVILETIMGTFLDISEKHKDTIMPGYTHLQKAQPVYFGYHLMSYFQMFMRDHERLKDQYKRIDRMPLGSGALAGVNYETNRELVAEILKFESVTTHAMDSVSDRDHVIEYTSTASIIMMHLSRLCEEMVNWSSQEFSFIELSDEFATGSSIMPQKKNPDTPELIRGKTGRVYGNLLQILTVMKALPLAYNKDMQEDKESLFDTVYTVENSLVVIDEVLKTMTVKTDNMLKGAQNGYLNATDVADYIVKKGGTFREAHNVVGKLVLHALNSQKEIGQLSIEEIRKFSHYFDQDLFHEIEVKNVIEKKMSSGSTSTESLEKIFALGRAYLQASS